MALFRKFFYRKPPDGLLEISERVYVFDCCFTTDVLEDNGYKIYMAGIVAQLRDQFPDVSFMVFNFREGETQSQISTILLEHDMTVMDYPRQYEGCPLLTMEMIHHFMRSGESWLSLGQHNLLLMHCERGGWPVLAFMLAALLVYRKQYPGEQKTLEMIYKQAPRELLQLLSPLNPVPSQLRYLQYISRRNVGSEWPPLDRVLTLDCIILRLIPDFDGQGGCRPIFRIYGQNPLIASDRSPKILFSTPKKSQLVRLYKQADSELVKFDIDCHIQGDVVLECISLDEELKREEMMFRVMFNTAFIRSNILMLNRDAIDILWDSKDRFPKDFRVEILLSEMDAATSICTTHFPTIEEKDGLPVEAFAKVQEMFNDVDWLATKGDVSAKVLQQIASSNARQEMIDDVSPQLADGMQDKSSPDVPRDITSFNTLEEKMDNVSLQKIESATRQAQSSLGFLQGKVLRNETGDESKTLSSISPVQQPGCTASCKDSFPKHKNIQVHEWQAPIKCSTQLEIVPQHITASRSSPSFSSFSISGAARPVSRYRSAPSTLGITALLHDHAALVSSEVAHSTKISPTNISSSTISAFETSSSLRPSLQLQSPQESSAVPTEEILSSLPQEVSSLPPPANTTSITTIKGGDSTRTSHISNVSFKTPSSSTHAETLSATCSVPEVPTLASEMFSSSVHDTPSYPFSSVPQRFSAVSAISEVPTINQQTPNNKSHMSAPIPSPPPPLVASLRSHHPPKPSEKSVDRASIIPVPPPPPPQPLLTSSSPCNALYNLKKAVTTTSVLPPPPALLVSTNLSQFSQTLKRAIHTAEVLQRPPPSPPPPPPRSLMDTSSPKNSSPSKKVVSTTSVLPSPPPPPPPPPPDHPPQSPKKAIDTASVSSPPTPPPLPLTISSSSTHPLKLKGIGALCVPPAPSPPCRAPLSKDAPLAPPPPQISSKHTGGATFRISSVPPAPPPPASNSLKGSSAASSHSTSSGAKGNGVIVPPPPPKGMNATMTGKCQAMAHTGAPQKTQSSQSSSRKTNLKPLHWVKVTRAMQGSLWAEAQKSDELSKAPEFDMSELESLFSAAVPNSDPHGSTERSSGRLSSSKPDKVHLIDLRRANNCEIMLTKVKIPLSDLLSSVLALDDALLDVDQIDNIIKFCPTKEEMELLKGYNGDKETLGKCEQYFLELMRIPRVESKLRVFSFKIQFRSQVSDLSNNLNIVNSASDEIRSSIKLKRIMQTILSLGNALNQGTARGSAVGFRLDSLLKLTDTRARNNKITLMHYLCKVLADKLPELLDFPKDLVSLEIAAKIQLKTLAEEMQAISKGLEKVERELIASENDGPVSQSFCKTLKEFLTMAEAEVRVLTSRYSSVGRNADALALYFGEDPAKCPFEQVVSTLLNFVKMFVRAHEENFKQLELEKKKAQKEAENDKMKLSNSKEQNSLSLSPKHASTK